MAQPIIRILKRQPNSEPCLSDLSYGVLKKVEVKNRPIKTLEEREAAYAEARMRILGSSHDNSSTDNSKEIECNQPDKMTAQSFTTTTQQQPLIKSTIISTQLATCATTATRSTTPKMEQATIIGKCATVSVKNAVSNVSSASNVNGCNITKPQPVTTLATPPTLTNNIISELYKPATNNNTRLSATRNIPVNVAEEKATVAIILKSDSDKIQPMEERAIINSQLATVMMQSTNTPSKGSATTDTNKLTENTLTKDIIIERRSLNSYLTNNQIDDVTRYDIGSTQPGTDDNIFVPLNSPPTSNAAIATNNINFYNVAATREQLATENVATHPKLNLIDYPLLIKNSK